MAGRTITQRIALDGGEQIKSQLDAIGRAGQAAFKKFQDAANANATLTKFGPTLDGLKAKAQAVGEAGRRLGQDFNTLGDRVTRSARNIAVAGTVIIGLVVGFGHLVTSAGEAADKLREAAEAAGLTTKELSNLQFAAQQSSVSGDKLSKSLARLNKALDDEGKRTDDLGKKQRDLSDDFNSGKLSMEDYLAQSMKMTREAQEQDSAFNRLGISVKGADGEVKKTLPALLEIANRFKGMPDGAKKAGLAMGIFSRDGASLIPFLNQGEEGIRKLMEEAERVAPAMTKFQLAVADRMGDSLDTLKKAATSAKDSLLLLFAPAMTRLSDALIESIVGNRAAMFAFASTVADRVTPVVNDLIALLEGRDISKDSFVAQARDAMVAFASATKTAVTDIIIPAFQGLLKILQVVAEAINGIFGTNLTGGQIAAAVVITKLVGLFGVLAISIKLVVSAVALLVAVFGGLPLIIAAITAAFAFFILQSVGGVKGLQTAWTSTWNAIAGVVTGALNAIAALFGALVAGVQFGASAIASAFTVAWDAISTKAGQIVTNIISFFTRLPAALGVIFTAILQWATDTWNAIVAKAVDIGAGIVGAFQSSISTVTGAFKALYDYVVGIFERIVAAAKEKVPAWVRNLIGSGGGAPGAATGGAVQAAGGGHVRGPGSSMSDSISAWLSDGEFVQRAKAVRKYGVDFMHALNQGRLSTDSVRGLMRGFNTGGLVESLSALVPRQSFATGGMVLAAAGGGTSSGRPLTLVVEGNRFDGLNAPTDVAKAMERFASKRAVRSAGRKPSWYQG